jgi:hypothetical protein
MMITVANINVQNSSNNFKSDWGQHLNLRGFLHLDKMSFPRFLWLAFKGHPRNAVIVIVKIP